MPLKHFPKIDAFPEKIEETRYSFVKSDDRLSYNFFRVGRKLGEIRFHSEAGVLCFVTTNDDNFSDELFPEEMLKAASFMADMQINLDYLEV